MLRRLRLTKPQRDDAVTKYTQVAKLLHSKFYDTAYDGSTKLIIGSYGKKTNIRPPGDIDLLFKIPLETYEQYLNHSDNGPSALLQRIRTILGDKYTATEKISAWGKVVLVKFSDGKHNVELLPGYEIEGVFMIPNSEDGGSWESFDARADLKIVSDSQTATGGKTRPLVKIIKRWGKMNSTMTIKSFEIEKLCADFLEQEDWGEETWSELIAHFFSWLSQNAQQDVTFIKTANTRASNAYACELKGEIENACDEWKKIFGAAFPAHSAALNKVYVLGQQYPSPVEEFIEDLFPVRIIPGHTVNISATISGSGFLTRTLRDFLSRYSAIPKNLSLNFEASTSVPGLVEFWWKVRNFGVEAKSVNIGKGLRGEITGGPGANKKRETTLYDGIHYVECYVIQNGICIAKKLQEVPITRGAT